MIDKLLGGATGPYVAAAVGLSFLGLVLAATVQTARLDNAKKDLTTARAALKDPITKKTWQDLAVQRGNDLTICQNNVKNLDAAITLQNTAVEALRSAGATRTAAANEALKAAGVIAETSRTQAASIMRLKPGPDTCVSALELVRAK